MRSILLLFALFSSSHGNNHDGPSLVDRGNVPSSACGRDSQFEASILIEHDMVDPEKVDQQELQYLEKAFVSVYNGLNTPNVNDLVCDAAFLRFAIKPKIEAKEIFYRDLPGGKRLARRNFLYTVTMSGKGTTSDTPIFDFGTPRWELLPTNDEIASSNTGTRTCECSSKAEARAPTAEEFKDGFNAFIQNLQTVGKLSNINAVHYVSDLEDVDCNPTENEFEVDVNIDLKRGIAEGIVDFAQLESKFQDSYNELANSYCDPCFRTVSSVSIEALESTAKNSKVEKSLKATVKGQSRCADTSSLFDNSHRRLIAGLEASGEFHGRRLVSDNACFCPTHPAASRAPSTSEFVEAFSHVAKGTGHIQVMAVAEQ